MRDLAKIVLGGLAVMLVLGLTCDEKDEAFFTLLGGGNLPGTGDIVGTVTVDGSPRSGVTVTLRNQAGQVVATDVTGVNGSYGFLNADPGTYTVSISPPSGATCSPSEKSATVNVEDTTVVDFSCSTPQPTTGTLTVHVTTSGSPQSGATVMISHTGGSRTGTTGANGVATFENLDPGMYTVTTTLTGHSCGGGSGTVTAGQTTNVDVTCTAQQSTVPTTAQNSGTWNYMRSRTSTSGSCPTALPSSGTGTMTALSPTSMMVNGLDPDVPVSGSYNTSTGAYSGSGSTLLMNGFTVMTTLNANFSFDGSMNPIYNDVMTRIHSFSGSTVCTETYTTSGAHSVPSSARFKRGVTSLLPDGMTLMGLRPVAFRYRSLYGDPAVPRVGLIAEEVARVFPEALAYDDRGRPAGIYYPVLTGLVLEELGARLGGAVAAGVERLAGSP